MALEAPIVVTAGDPAGIGPEVASALASSAFAADVVVVGDRSLLSDELDVIHTPFPSPVAAGRPDPANARTLLDGLEMAVRGCLEAAEIPHDVFAELQANPVGADVDRGVATFRRGEHDGVVAVGGGSALDVGKLIAFMAGQTRPVWDFEDVGDNWTRADADTIAPVVAIPTTAGTGSEVGRAGVVVRGGRRPGTKMVRKEAGEEPADAQRGEAERRPEPERERSASATARQDVPSASYRTSM